MTTGGGAGKAIPDPLDRPGGELGDLGPVAISRSALRARIWSSTATIGARR